MRFAVAVVSTAALSVALTGQAGASPHATKVTLFTVNTIEDSDLSTPGVTVCVDAATGRCSLRAAVDAANNLGKPVKIVLATTAYKLTLGVLDVLNPAGTSIVGQGSGKTTISGGGDQQLFSVLSGAASSASAELELTGVTLTQGDADDGGALQLASTGATAVLANDVLTGNVASTQGGAIDAAGNDTLYLTNTTVSDNIAPDGGGIDAYKMDGQFTNSHIDDNIASSTGSEGGGIFVSYGVIDMRGGSVNGNSAGDGSDPGEGGGIYDRQYADLNLTGVAINDDQVEDGGQGGGLYLEKDQVDLTGGSVSHDSTAGTGGFGGGIAFDGATQSQLNGVNLADDMVAGTAADAHGGGAIYDSSGTQGSDLTIDDGTTITGANNSAVYVLANNGAADVTIDGSTLTHNSDASLNVEGQLNSACGAAVCGYGHTDGSVSLEMDNDSLSNNATTGQYGPGAVGLVTNTSGTGVGHFTKDTFTSNSAGTNGLGGAIGAQGYNTSTPITVTTTADKFVKNSSGTTAAPGEGGAVSMLAFGTYSDNGSTFTGNKVIGNGGAVYAATFDSSDFDNTVMSGNSADTSTGLGGAVYASDSGGTQFRHVTLSGNSAEDGGAFYGSVEDEAAEFFDSTLSGNTAGSTTAVGAGGAINVSDALLVLTNTTVADNVAKSTGSAGGEGGGIWQNGARANLQYSTVTGNTAAAGGGIYQLGDGGSFLATIVSGNKDGSKESDCESTAATAQSSSLGGNVLGEADCVASTQASDDVSTKAGVKSLASNGGSTKTIALTASSPARGRGGYDCPTTDERGQTRSSSACDAGAYQFAAGSVTKLSPKSAKAEAKVTITGSGFRFARKVFFGSKSVKFMIVNNTKITTKAPTGRGKVAVKVQTVDGSAKKGSFTYKK